MIEKIKDQDPPGPAGRQTADSGIRENMTGECEITPLLSSQAEIL